MPNPILIAYATKYGATEEIAVKIGATLKQAGLSVEVLTRRSSERGRRISAIVLSSAVLCRDVAQRSHRFSGGQ